MSSFFSNQRYGVQDPSRRYTGWAIVIAIHLLIGWALISGTARKGLELIKKPLEAAVIQEVIIPPPPPPPPKEIKREEPKVKTEAPPPYVPPPDVTPDSNAPTISSVATPPPAPVAIAPPAPPAPPAPRATRAEIGVVCPSQVRPEMPRQALREGIEGVIRAQAVIAGGVVKDVTILSGPRVFHSAVKTAMMQYKCTSDAAEITATQEFVFKLD